MTPLEMKALSERMWNAGVRIEQMFWLGGGLAHCATSEFREFVEDDLADAKHVLAALPFLMNFNGAADEIPGECIFHRKTGFIAQMATPIPHNFSKDGKSHSLSWGSRRIEWVYADTLAEICEHAERFAGEVLAAERKKAKKR